MTIVYFHVSARFIQSVFFKYGKPSNWPGIHKLANTPCHIVMGLWCVLVFHDTSHTDNAHSQRQQPSVITDLMIRLRNKSKTQFLKPVVR